MHMWEMAHAKLIDDMGGDGAYKTVSLPSNSPMEPLNGSISFPLTLPPRNSTSASNDTKDYSLNPRGTVSPHPPVLKDVSGVKEGNGGNMVQRVSSSIRLSAILSEKTNQLHGDVQEMVWRVFWNREGVCYCRHFEDEESTGDGLNGALCTISRLLQDPVAVEGTAVSEIATLSPYYKQWSLQELEVLERRYILSSEVCGSQYISRSPPSITGFPNFSLTPCKRLSDAILSEVKALSYDMLSEDASSFTSHSNSEILKEILDETVSDEEKDAYSNRNFVAAEDSDDEITRGRLEANLHEFFASTKSNAFDSTQSKNPTGKRYAVDLRGVDTAPKRKKSMKEQYKSSRKQAYNLQPMTNEVGGAVLDIDRKMLPTAALQTGSKNGEKEISKKHMPKSRKVVASHSSQGVPSLEEKTEVLGRLDKSLELQESLWKVEGENSSVSDGAAAAAGSNALFMNSSNESYYPLETTEQEESMLNVLETLQKELLTEHFQLHENRLLTNGIQLEEYVDLLKEIPAKLNEHLIKIRILDADVRILLDDQCMPLQKALSQLYAEKQSRVAGLLAQSVPPTHKAYSDASNVAKVSYSKEDTGLGNKPLQMGASLETSDLEIVAAGTSFSSHQGKDQALIASNNEDISSNSLCTPTVGTSIVDNAGKDEIDTSLQLTTSRTACTTGNASSTSSTTATVPNPLYWDEAELQQLRLCESLYAQIESASSLKIDLCDSLHAMLDRRIHLLDTKFKQYETFHDLFYGKDVVKPSGIPSAAVKYKTLNVKHNNAYVAFTDGSERKKDNEITNQNAPSLPS